MNGSGIMLACPVSEASRVGEIVGNHSLHQRRISRLSVPSFEIHADHHRHP
jgi:hypothetical protein